MQAFVLARLIRARYNGTKRRSVGKRTHLSSACVVQIALDEWPSSARLPRALKAAGLRVIAICRQNSPLGLTRHLSGFITTGGSELQNQLDLVIEAHDPVAIIPSDERAVRYLYALAASRDVSPRLLGLLRRSLGDPAAYPTLSSKWLTAELARQLDILVPEQAVASTNEDAVSTARAIGFPVILKREDTYGGMGCIICRSEEEVRRAFSDLRVVSLLRRRLRAIGRSDPAQFAASSRKPLILQRFHEGTLAMSACVADGGRLVTGLTAVAEEINPAPTGASSVLRAVPLPELLEVSRRLIEATGASGFLGFDFVLDRTGGRPYLLEINPRVTPLCNVSGLLGTDLSVAFAAAFAGIECSARTSPGKERVALFPNEWIRDPSSPHLKTDYYDVPRDDAALIEDAYRRLPLMRRLRSRLDGSFPEGVGSRRRGAWQRGAIRT